MKRLGFGILIALFILAIESELPSRFHADEGTSRIATRYAVILPLDDKGESCKFLAKNFDRIYEMIAGYFNLKLKDERIIIWVVDFDVLQGMYSGQENYPGGSPDIVCALYHPPSNSLFFTAPYINDYYVTHELLHYFIDNYEEEIVTELSKIIIRRKLAEER